MKIKNQKGQGMIEYVILAALISVASVGIVSVFGQTVKAKLAQITAALQGRSADPIQVEKVEEKHWRKRGLNDFYKYDGRSENER